ncbi:DUF4878 domain-containing protein [Anaerotignum sp.]|uniref:DUF4878 domain-containing protein n=1 Tax=Anaerotignum sp. TaxID=2039241 RepID=UPI00271486B3|nr:DUF4878 domain-containing protein [Anaerotignum sp.]
MFKKFLAICFIFILSFSCISCGNKSDSPETVVANYFNALKSGDLESAKAYVKDGNDQILNDTEEEESATEMNYILGTLSYHVISTEINDSTATVKTTITNVDMKPVMGEFVTQLFSLAFSGLDEEELEAKQKEAFASAFEANKDTTIDTEVDIQLEKTETGWVINPTDDLADGITGGLLSVGKDLANSFGADVEDNGDESTN